LKLPGFLHLKNMSLKYLVLVIFVIQIADSLQTDSSKNVSITLQNDGWMVCEAILNFIQNWFSLEMGPDLTRHKLNFDPH